MDQLVEEMHNGVKLFYDGPTHSRSIRIVCYWVVSVQDLLLGCRVGAHDVVRVYDAADAGKNKVSQEGPLRKVYSV